MGRFLFVALAITMGGCNPITPGPAPMPPDASDASTPTCQDACTALVKAGCSFWDKPGCATYLSTMELEGESATSSSKKLTCADIAKVKTPADARSLNFTCSTGDASP